VVKFAQYGPQTSCGPRRFLAIGVVPGADHIKLLTDAMFRGDGFRRCLSSLPPSKRSISDGEPCGRESALKAPDLFDPLAETGLENALLKGPPFHACRRALSARPCCLQRCRDNA